MEVLMHNNSHQVPFASSSVNNTTNEVPPSPTTLSESSANAASSYVRMNYSSQMHKHHSRQQVSKGSSFPVGVRTQPLTVVHGTAEASRNYHTYPATYSVPFQSTNSSAYSTYSSPAPGSYATSQEYYTPSPQTASSAPYGGSSYTASPFPRGSLPYLYNDVGSYTSSPSLAVASASTTPKAPVELYTAQVISASSSPPPSQKTVKTEATPSSSVTPHLMSFQTSDDVPIGIPVYPTKGMSSTLAKEVLGSPTAAMMATPPPSKMEVFVGNQVGRSTEDDSESPASIELEFQCMYNQSGRTMATSSSTTKQQLDMIRIWKHVPTNQIYFDCVCGKRKPLKNLTAIIKHTSRHFKTQAAIYRCNKCDRVFAHYLGLNSHQRLHKESEMVDPEPESS